MEAAAIALTCASHDLPFLSIKDISNNELLHVTDSVSFGALEPELGRRAAALLRETIGGLVGEDLS
jgi:nucleoside phosphorylase